MGIIKTMVITIVAIFIIYKFWSEENFISYLFVNILNPNYKGTDKNNPVDIEFSNSVNTFIIILVCVFFITLLLWIKCQQNECGLYFIRSSIIILLVAEISMAIFFKIIVDQEELIDYARKKLPKLMNNYTDSYLSRTVWDLMQSSLKCCGYTHQDWPPHDYCNCNKQIEQVPLSCCNGLQPNQTICIEYIEEHTKSPYWYENPCEHNFEQFLKYFYSIYIMVFLGLTITKILAIFVANYYFEQLTKTFTCAPTKIARRKNIGGKPLKKNKKCDSIHLGVI